MWSSVCCGLEQRGADGKAETRQDEQLAEEQKKRTHRVAPNVALLHLPEPLSVRARLEDLTQYKVHKVVACREVAVERLAVLELDELVVCRWMDKEFGEQGEAERMKRRRVGYVWDVARRGRGSSR